MDYRNFSPAKLYTDESLQPQGPLRLKTSTPRGRRPNPYQKSPDAGLGSPPSEGPRNKSWRHSHDSWKSRDSSRNSSFNSSFNSPGGPGRRYHGGNQREHSSNSWFGNIAAYYHPSMMENPWHHLEKSIGADSGNVSVNPESVGLNKEDKSDDFSDEGGNSPDVLVESIKEYSNDSTKDESSINIVSSP